MIWGKTRPELSRKYKETVCTGGVFEDTKKLVRLYPLPLRFLQEDKLFAKYQWIEASVMKSNQDPRPESYRIRIDDDITPLEKILSTRGNWDERAKWILREENIYQSVEHLQERQTRDQTSIGLIKPREVCDVLAQEFSEKEKAEFQERYRISIAQTELDLGESSETVSKPLPPPDLRFKVRFRCADDRCKDVHEFSILDWEPSALFAKQLAQKGSKESATSDVLNKLENCFSADKDLYFFLGNMVSHPRTFSVVGLWYPKRKPPKSAEQELLF